MNCTLTGLIFLVYAFLSHLNAPFYPNLIDFVSLTVHDISMVRLECETPSMDRTTLSPRMTYYCLWLLLLYLVIELQDYSTNTHVTTLIIAFI